MWTGKFFCDFKTMTTFERSRLIIFLFLRRAEMVGTATESSVLSSDRRLVRISYENH